MPAVRSTDRPLVGREEELAFLLALLGLPGGVRGGGVLLGGDAGVGKTRLVTEVCAGARDAGWLVLQGLWQWALAWLNGGSSWRWALVLLAGPVLGLGLLAGGLVLLLVW